MAEFCLECFNKMQKSQHTKDDVKISADDDLDLCEGCGEIKPVVICFK